MVKARAALVTLVLAGCSGDGELAADYSLRLMPRFLDGQRILDGEPEIEVVLAYPDGTTEITKAGKAKAGGELKLEGLPPLPAGTAVGLVARQDGAATAYGQVHVREDLTTGAQQQDLEVLVTSTGEIGRLGAQGPAKQRLAGALAVLPGGNAYIFGGGDPSDVALRPVSSKSVLKLSGLDEGDVTFDNVGDLPAAETPAGVEVKKRASVSATVVHVEGEPMILVAGGRGDWAFSGDNLANWFLWDPVTDTVAEQGNLKIDRSGHLAIALGNGDVLLIGGLSGTFVQTNVSYEIFEVDRLKTAEGRNADRLEIGQWNLFGAPHQGDAVVCGGTTYSGNRWIPIDGCNLVQIDGDVEAFPPLPLPLASAAMAPLPNGELLVTGGFTDEIVDSGAYDFGDAPAVANAFVYNPENDSWRGVGEMNHARAHHQMVPLQDGRVLIVGGTATGTGLYGDVVDPVRTPEIYDPNGDTFTEIEGTDVGQGAEPLVGFYPGDGAVIVEGHYVQGYGAYLGTAEYGVISTGPPLQP